MPSAHVLNLSSFDLELAKPSDQDQSKPVLPGCYQFKNNFKKDICVRSANHNTIKFSKHLKRVINLHVI